MDGYTTTKTDRCFTIDPLPPPISPPEAQLQLQMSLTSLIKLIETPGKLVSSDSCYFELGQMPKHFLI